MLPPADMLPIANPMAAPMPIPKATLPRTINAVFHFLGLVAIVTIARARNRTRAPGLVAALGREYQAMPLSQTVGRRMHCIERNGTYSTRAALVRAPPRQVHSPMVCQKPSKNARLIRAGLLALCLRLGPSMENALCRLTENLLRRYTKGQN